MHLFKNLPLDPEKQIAPMTKLFFMTQALVVNSELKVKSRRRAGRARQGQSQDAELYRAGAALVLFMESLNRQHGIDLVRVPFRGGGDAVNGVLSGMSPITFFGIGNMMPHLRAGTMTGLLVDGDKRTPLCRMSPTITEYRLQGSADALLLRALRAGRHGEGPD